MLRKQTLLLEQKPAISAPRLPWRIAIALGLLGLLILVLICAPLLSQYDPSVQQAQARLQAPNATHWLGTDRYGRDIFARVLYGGRTTLLASATALAAVVLIGLGLGILAGVYRGWLDLLIMRLIDTLQAFPFMVLALILTGFLGKGLNQVLIAIIAVWWVDFARVARSLVFQMQHDRSIEASRCLGAPMYSLIWRDILPRASGPILVLATFELGQLILSLAALSFLGLGVQAPQAEWGAMLADSRAHMLQAPHLLLGPGLGIFTLVFTLNLLGESLRDWLDPSDIA